MTETKNNHLLCEIPDCGKVAKYEIAPAQMVWEIKENGDPELIDTRIAEDESQVFCEEHAKRAGFIY